MASHQARGRQRIWTCLACGTALLDHPPMRQWAPLRTDPPAPDGLRHDARPWLGPGLRPRADHAPDAHRPARTRGRAGPRRRTGLDADARVGE